MLRVLGLLVVRRGRRCHCYRGGLLARGTAVTETVVNRTRVFLFVRGTM